MNWQSIQNRFFGLGAEYGINPLIFGAIYVGAIPFFSLSIEWLVRNYSRGKSVAVPALAAMFFLISAYIYLIFAGKNVPWETFTEPEIGRVGLIEVEAKEKFGAESVKIYKVSFEDNDHTQASGATQGFAKVVTNGGKIVGATVVATVAKKNELLFTVLSDPKLETGAHAVSHIISRRFIESPPEISGGLFASTALRKSCEQFISVKTRVRAALLFSARKRKRI